MKSLLFSLALATATTLQASALIPSPIECRTDGKTVTGHAAYSLDDQFGIPAGTASWIDDEFRDNLGCRREIVPGGFVIRLKKAAARPNPEHYVLSIDTSRVITLSAASQEGMVRAVARLLCIISLPPAEADGKGSVTLPLLAIDDAPHFPFRAVTFTTNMGRPYSTELEISLRREINVAAKLGYNRAIFDIGGRFDLQKHPEIVRRPAWPREMLHAMISYAAARGIKALPGTNSIGHIGGAPAIFPLGGVRYYQGKERYAKELIMDLSHIDFYRVWFDYLDELCEFFGNPELCFIGTDEFHRGLELLEAKMKRKYWDFYPEFVNRTAAHLSEKGVRTMIAHDMLADRAKYTTDRGRRWEEANGTREIYDKIDKSVIIDYWNYNPAPEYPLLKNLKASGHELMLQFWQNTDNAPVLSALAADLGIQMMCTGLFGLNANEHGMIENAEYFWNPRSKKRHNDPSFQRNADILFTSRKDVNKLELTPLPATSGLPPIPEYVRNILKKRFPSGSFNEKNVTMNLQNAVFCGLAVPLRRIETSELAANSSSRIAAHPAGSMEYVSLGKYILNPKRRQHGFSLYTPEFGNSTLTNCYGHEFAFADGKLLPGNMPGSSTALEMQIGDMKIPSDGMVFSSYFVFANREKHALDFQRKMIPGNRIEFFELPENVKEVKVAYRLPPGQTMVLLYAPFPFEKARHPFFKAPEMVSLSLFETGQRLLLRLTANDLFYRNRIAEGWKIWSGDSESSTGFIMALETPLLGNPTELVITVTQEGRIAGLTILGVAGIPTNQ